MVSVSRHDGKKKEKKNRGTDWWCSNVHRRSVDRRLEIVDKVQISAQVDVIIVRGIVSTSLARVQTTQVGGGI